MDIEYPNPKCRKSPTGAHHYIGSNCHIFECKYCPAVLALPRTLEGAIALSIGMQRYGLDYAYNRWLSFRPDVKEELEEVLR